MAEANAQTTVQLWGTVTFNWLKSDQLSYELELEPKVLLGAPAGEPGWANLDVTPNVEYAFRPWLDGVAERETDSVVRFRNRLEFQVPMNRGLFDVRQHFQPSREAGVLTSSRGLRRSGISITRTAG